MKQSATVLTPAVYLAVLVTCWHAVATPVDAAPGERAYTNATYSSALDYPWRYLGPNYSVPAGGDGFFNLWVGYDAAGSVSHSTGTLTITGFLSLGPYFYGNGTYSLGGSATLSTNNVSVGAQGPGTFNQTGGIHTVSGTLSVGSSLYSSALGTYHLSGGTLSALVSSSLNGTFNFRTGSRSATN